MQADRRRHDYWTLDTFEPQSNPLARFLLVTLLPANSKRRGWAIAILLVGLVLMGTNL